MPTGSHTHNCVTILLDFAAKEIHLHGRLAVALTLLVLCSVFAQLGSAPNFVDETARSGITFKSDSSRTSQKYLPETMLGGIAMLDYDNDGWLDLYFVNGAKLDDPMPEGKTPDKSEPRFWNRLYKNNGDGSFTDVTERAGVRGHSYGMGAAVGDYNNDGYPDLYVTNFGSNILYRNNRNGTFSDVTVKTGVGGAGWSTSAAFIDYDRDGDLDLIVARYLDWDFSKNIWCGDRQPSHRAYCHPKQFEAVSHLLFRNEGGEAFVDVTKQAGFAKAPGKGLGVAFNDFDRDGWLDALIANDSFPQQLFRNNRNGEFVETGLQAGVAYDEDGKMFAGMGLDFADYDNDGWPDAFVNALGNEKYAIFRNAKGTFEYASGPTGVGAATALHSGWGARFFDYDNDGWKDLFVAQGHVMDNIELTQPSLRYREPLLLMSNKGGAFADISERVGEAFRISRAARGAAIGDLNNDGSLDIVVYCNNAPPVILLGTGGSNHWLMVRTVGTLSNRDGIGAKLRLTSESGQQQYAIVSPAGSYLSASDRRVHFGLGKDKRARSLEVEWPSGLIQTLNEIRADQILTIEEPRDKSKSK